ncbi:MAG TPA: lysylphosphatidylglycerol synthase transmembrane domain-containing protein [Conexibacter sp.]|nr:lysylphosphatidylglycerol synthase transmembrane domain-containing protein [Conexibacter sp.]
MSHRTKRLLLLVVWVIPIAGVVWWATKQRAPTFPSTFGGIMALVGALALYAVATTMRSERWLQILRRSDVGDASRADAHALVPIGYMGNNVLPARGGEVLRTFLLDGRVQATKRTILGTILAERVLDAVALGVILVVLAADLLHRLPKPNEKLVLLGVGIAVALLLVAVVAFVRYRERLVFVLRALAPMLAPTKRLLSRFGLVLLVVSLLIWCVEASVYMAVGHAAGITLSIQDALAVVAFTNAASLIPAAPGYIGTYDAAVVFSVGAVSTASHATILSYLLLLRFVLFIPITLVGLGLLAARYGGLSRIRAARAAARADATRADATAPAAA